MNKCSIVFIIATMISVVYAGEVETTINFSLEDFVLAKKMVMIV